MSKACKHSLLLPGMLLAGALSAQTLTGQDIMQRVYQGQHQSPYIYEEATLILVDKQHNRDVRDLRSYTRVDASGQLNFLLVFDSPQEIRGVALLVRQKPEETLDSALIYLPAFDNRLMRASGQGSSQHFLGSDFSVHDLLPEQPGDFIYRRMEDLQVADSVYYVVESRPANAQVRERTGYARRVHTISPQHFFEVHTDFYDRNNRLLKSMSQHEFSQYGDSQWFANMRLMENHQERHLTLLKHRQRIFSPDYVPSKMFNRQWLFNHYHMASTLQHIYDQTLNPEAQTAPAGDRP